MRKLITILIIGFFLRVYGVNWDLGFHLHPDERMLIMVADKIHFFNQLNPDFFNYGTLPIYILKGSAQLIDFIFKTTYATYDGMLLFGRYISIICDLLIIILIYKISQLLFKKQSISQFACFFYAIAFFPIQNSHFFVVDVFLNLFSTLLIFLLLKFINLTSLVRPHQSGNVYRYVILIGITYAAMLTTKFTAVVFLPLILLIFILFSIFQSPIRGTCLPAGRFAFLIRSIRIIFPFSSTLFVFSFLFMPYAFLNHERFISDVLAQMKMNSDPYIFPYTLQYVATTPYLYYLKNIFLWGLGPIISIMSIVGFCFLMINLKLKTQNSNPQLKTKIFFFQITNYQLLITIFLLFYLFYFIVIGRSAVKFMRYMLLLYPMFCIMAAYGINYIKVSFKSKLLNYIITLLLIFSCIYCLMFVNIYSQQHTRIAATEWINKNIPAGSYVATEHWDDGMPLTGGEKFNRIELPLYERPDDKRKWDELITPRLKQAEYIIIASNRLYVPLQKLADCNKYTSCYPITAKYYKDLFAGQLGFKQIAEFAAYPSLPLITQLLNYPITINDQSADESFTVYDHPKIIIFKKI